MLSLGKVVEVNPFEVTFATPPTTPVEESDFYSRFLLLKSLKLTEYKLIVVLTHNNLVIRNIDSLFRCPPPCGGFDTDVWSVTTEGPVLHGELFVLTPSIKDHYDILNMAKTIPYNEISYLRDESISTFGAYGAALIRVYYGLRMTALSLELGGINVKIYSTTRRWARFTYNPKHAVLNFASMSISPWEVNDPYKVLSWENVIYRDYYLMYYQIMKEYEDGLSYNQRHIFGSLTMLYSDLHCEREECKTSEPLRKDPNSDVIEFELKFMKQFWQSLYDHYLDPRYHNVTVTKIRRNICLERVKCYAEELSKHEGQKVNNQ
eukprot:TRINITY_DN3710_c0_g1_i2.p1 TRINITY_DN3710_c0_g1~~TRINITY_DN3710_c0_g1_i2.p1  ORF type:complete len:320 (+),score=25.67 TRINITY_DN3710_c0_g1_i2:305-1264(+)